MGANLKEGTKKVLKLYPLVESMFTSDQFLKFGGSILDSKHSLVRNTHVELHPLPCGCSKTN